MQGRTTHRDSQRVMVGISLTRSELSVVHMLRGKTSLSGYVRELTEWAIWSLATDDERAEILNDNDFGPRMIKESHARRARQKQARRRARRFAARGLDEKAITTLLRAEYRESEADLASLAGLAAAERWIEEQRRWRASTLRQRAGRNEQDKPRKCPDPPKHPAPPTPEWVEE